MAGQPALQVADRQAQAGHGPNRAWFEQIIQAQRGGKGCLPFHLGLDAADYAELLRTNFPEQAREAAAARDPLRRECSELRAELLALRRDEWLELRDLLLAGRRGNDCGEVWMACIVAAGCLGGDHLWRDLGLASRLDLQELLMHNFPRLAVRNVQDMRWKKFFYKQLCEQDGGYVCRSPSCEQCPTYHDCFGEET